MRDLSYSLSLLYLPLAGFTVSPTSTRAHTRVCLFWNITRQSREDCRRSYDVFAGNSHAFAYMRLFFMSQEQNKHISFSLDDDWIHCLSIRTIIAWHVTTHTSVSLSRSLSLDTVRSRSNIHIAFEEIRHDYRIRISAAMTSIRFTQEGVGDVRERECSTVQQRQLEILVKVW